MPHPFDATLKDILSQSPESLREPFRLPAIEPARTLNIDLSTISAATDVAVGFGDPVQEIVDLNFQSGPDPRVAARLLLYNIALYLKFGVPVRSILVLLRPEGRDEWTERKTVLHKRRQASIIRLRSDPTLARAGRAVSGRKP